MRHSSTLGRGLAAASALLAGACGSAAKPVATAPTTVVPAAPTTAAPTPETMTPTPTTGGGTPAAGGFATAAVAVKGSGATSLLGTVRAARQDGFDRMVFEFADRVPGYEVGYVDRPVLEDASGREVAVAGAAVLRMRMSPASGVELSTSGARSTYTGPDRLRPGGTAQIRELARAGDFEGVLTWVAGTDSRAPFRVTTLASPPRLVVDVRSS